MQRQDKDLISRVAKSLMWILFLMVACKFTKGLATALLVGFGVYAASTQKLGKALSCYILFPLFVVMNPFLASIGGVGNGILKIGFMVITVLLLLTAMRRHGQEKLPIGVLWVYLGVSIISSLTGYHPLVSFMKLLNFGFFILGLGFGLRNLDKRPADLFFLRGFILAVAAFIILGSLAVLPFPGIAYFSSIQDLIREYGVETINRQGLDSHKMVLLCGITNQSQCLAPLSVIATAWTLCDMLFVERRVSVLHMVIVGAALPLMFLTRSRCALLSFFVAMVAINTYCFANIPVSQKVKSGMRRAMMGFGVLMLIGAGVMEVKDQTITRWIRKTNDVKGDSRSVTEAFTSSRQGLIEESMRDYHKNPFFGCGFQVDDNIAYMIPQDKLVFSAPIEKGVLPVMILGEAGLVGEGVFIIFLLSFFGTCLSKHYAVTATLMIAYLITNLAEATFFSVGGAGGIMWVVTLAGGFTIDMIVKVQQKQRYAVMSF